MMNEKNRTLHASRHPSLLPLRMALTAAERESPSRPLKVTSDEHRALELIERMKTGYNKPLPFMSWRDETGSSMFDLQEVIGSYV